MYQYYFKYYRKVEAACNFKSYFKKEREREREKREMDSMSTRELQSRAYNYKVNCTRNINLAMTGRGH